MRSIPQTPHDGLTKPPLGTEAEASSLVKFQQEFAADLDYLSASEIAEIYRAYQLSASAHAGQVRLSGEPYLSHPIAVAKVIAGLKLDAATIVAGLLHDVLEDTAVSKQEITAQFGTEVADIVDGVSKIEQLSSGHRKTTQMASFQKMLLATARDLRVILVKLADRLHNMRTLRYKSSIKQRNTARETLEVYVPMAQRLGIGKVWLELETLGFECLYPWRYRILCGALERNESKHERAMNSVFKNIEERFKLVELEHVLSKRKKDPYSVYRKMHEKRLTFAEVLDILAIRIGVKSVDDCYRALGQVHNLYNPKPGVFKDYIALPKPNGYQSLHTVLFGPGGIPVEVQIRTYDMENVAKSGIASHSFYKSEGSHSPATATRYKHTREWLENLATMHDEASDSEELFEDFKIGLISTEVYVFTPEGEIITLPRGATVLDFAFAVHTDIGLCCQSARVDKRLCSPSQELKTGQTVAITVSDTSHPTPHWLNFVVTPKARGAIRQDLKRIQGDTAVQLGKNLLDEALQDRNSKLEHIDTNILLQLVQAVGFESQQELFRDIGMGNQMPTLLARRLLGEDTLQTQDPSRQPLAIKGTEGIAVDYGKCCYPIPGDSIVGLINPGRGLVVHRSECPNIQRVKFRGQQFCLEWSKMRPKEREYLLGIRATVQHRRGMLATIAGQIAQMDSNIEHISLDNHTGSVAMLTFIITVRDRNHLAKIMRKIHNASKDIRITRIK